MGQNGESCRSDYGNNCFANSTLCEPYTVSPDARCDYVHCCCEHYASHEALFDYIYFQYCATWNNNNEVSNAIVMVIMGIYFVLILGNVADNFFAPIMAETAETLGVSHNIAGVTFLAFANGAPDISSSIAAFQMGGEQIKLGLGALLGVAVFNPIFISSVISTYAVNEPIKVVRFPFVRDCIFLFLAATSILRITLNGKIVIIEAVAMVLLYIIYVTTAVCSEIYSKKKKKNDLKTATVTATKSGTYKSLDNNDKDIDNNINNNNDADQYYPSAKHLWASIKHTQSLAASLAAQSIDIHHTANDNDINNKPKHWCVRGALLILYGPIYIARFIMKITIPLTDKDGWNDKFAVITCTTSPMFFFFVFELFEIGYYWIFALIFGIIMSIITYYLCKKKYKTVAVMEDNSGVELHSNKPKISESMQDVEGIKDGESMKHKLSSQPVMKYFFLLLGFLASVAWINFAAVEVVTILSTLGVVSSIDLSILGLTVLAWGNSTPDLVADVGVSKRGYAKMGIAAAIGGPTLDVLIGVGMGMTFVSIENGGETTMPISTNIFLGCVGVMTGITIYLTFVACNGWTLNKYFGYFLACYYITFLLVNIILYQTDVIIVS